jgi:hypothetical protein
MRIVALLDRLDQLDEKVFGPQRTPKNPKAPWLRYGVPATIVLAALITSATYAIARRDASYMGGVLPPIMAIGFVWCLRHLPRRRR